MFYLYWILFLDILFYFQISNKHIKCVKPDPMEHLTWKKNDSNKCWWKYKTSETLTPTDESKNWYCNKHFGTYVVMVVLCIIYDCNLTLRYITDRNPYMCSSKSIYKTVNRSLVYNSPALEPTKISINNREGKW